MIDSLMRSMIFSLSLMWLMEGRKKLQDGILPVSAIFSLSGHATDSHDLKLSYVWIWLLHSICVPNTIFGA